MQRKCYFYITDGWSVYPGFIPEGDQIVSKTYTTRVEGENTRLRHYLARLHRKTLCYSKERGNAQILNSIITPLSKILRCSSSAMIHTAIMQRLLGNETALLPKVVICLLRWHLSLCINPRLDFIFLYLYIRPGF